MGSVSPGLEVESVEGRSGMGGESTLAGVRRTTPSSLAPSELSACQGKLQELHRLLQSLESLHRIPSAPVIPTHQVRVLQPCVPTQCLLCSLSMPTALSRLCASGELCTLLHRGSPASPGLGGGCRPCLTLGIRTPLGSPLCQGSGTTERPKKGKRSSRMWCTQSFAKDDTMGRVRWGAVSWGWDGGGAVGTW